MVAPEPGAAAIRARYMKTFLAQVRELPEESTRAVVEKCADRIQEIEAATALAWLPLAVNVELTYAVARQLGARNAHVFFRDMMLASFSSSLMDSLVTAVVRVVGRDPGGYLNWLAKGHSLLFRDSGEFEVLDRENESATLLYTGLPSELLHDRVWLDSVASSLHALFLLGETDGAVTIRDFDAKQRQAEFRLRWHPR